MRPTDFTRAEIEASEWITLMSDRLISLEDRVRFEVWLSADPEHERVFRAQKSAWGVIPRMPHLLEEARADSQSVPLRRMRFAAGKPALKWAAAAAVLLALMALLGTRLSSTLPFFGQGRQFASDVGQIKDITLEDGSVVTLGASSRIAVTFRGAERRVSLVRGQAFFEVARDTARPFYVTAGSTLIRVVGTKFDVNLHTDAVRVSVLEGRVEVTKPGESVIHVDSEAAGAGVKPAALQDATQVLTAGEGVVAIRSGKIGPVRLEAEENMGAWRSGRLIYVDARLRDVVADMNRYYESGIVLTDEAAGEQRLTAAFRTDQIDRVTEVLTGALPIEVRRAPGGRILLSSRRN